MFTTRVRSGDVEKVIANRDWIVRTTYNLISELVSNLTHVTQPHVERVDLQNGIIIE